MNSTVNSNLLDIIYVNIDDSIPLSTSTIEVPQNLPEVKYSYQNNLLQFDYDNGLMIHKYTDGSTRYKGQWSDGVPNGKGTMYNKDGSVELEGEWKMGEFAPDSNHRYFYKDNKMEVKYDDGTMKYCGGWSHGVPEGKGEYFLPNGLSFINGEWEQGCYLIKDNKYFEYSSGLYVKKISIVLYRGEMNEYLEYDGKGTSYDYHGKKEYEGEWRKGKYYGQGKKYEKDVIIFDGEWVNNVPDGKGSYYEDGKVKYSGKWMDGFFHISGVKWFNWQNKMIEEYYPLKEKTVLFLPLKGYSIDEMGSDKLAKRIRCKCKTLSIMTPIVIIIVFYFLWFLFSPTVTVHSVLDYYMPKPFVRDLTIATGCGNGKHDSLKITGYSALQKLTIQERSFIHIESLEISNNPKLMSIRIEDASFSDNTAFHNTQLVTITSKSN